MTPVTALFVRAVFYDICNDELFTFPLIINEIQMDLYNDDFDNSNDLKKIKYRGVLENQCQGTIILGTL